MNPKEIGKHSFRPRFPREGIFFDPRGDIKPIGPTREQIDRADAVLGTLGDESGKALTPVTIGFGSTVLTVGALGTMAATHVIDIGSFPNIFNSSQDIEGLPDHLKKPEITKVNPEDIFDPNATKGVIGPKNTIGVTQEEYQKIAPPMIERESRKEIPVEFEIPPGADGRTTRKLTLEQSTSVNALIYIKTPEGGIREVHYTKVPNPGKVIGKYPLPVIFPGCTEYLGLKGEIQAGDIFPAPIGGRVYYEDSHPEGYDYYKGKKLEPGAVRGNYIIEGVYYDEEKDKKFRTIAAISMLNVFTKPVIDNIPNIMDPAFNPKAKFIEDGKEVERQGYISMNAKRDKMPIVTVQQGQNLFKFIDEPPVQHYNPVSPIKSQVMVSVSYEGDIGENDIANTFGGENCTHPTLDNKGIVLK